MYARRTPRLLHWLASLVLALPSLAGTWSPGTWTYSAGDVYQSASWKCSAPSGLYVSIGTYTTSDGGATWNWSGWASATWDGTYYVRSVNVLFGGGTAGYRRGYKVVARVGSTGGEQDATTLIAPSAGQYPSANTVCYLTATPPGGGSGGSSTWKMDYTVQNNTTWVQNYQVDYNGDGVVDDSFNLRPGETTTLHYSTDVAPTQNGTITKREYAGDGQWIQSGVDTFTPTQWTDSGAAGSDSYTDTTHPPPDTTSKDASSTSYNSPSGGALTESTFKTGIESIRKVLVEANGQGNNVSVTLDTTPIVDAIEHAEHSATNSAGQARRDAGLGRDYNSEVTGAKTGAETAAATARGVFDTATAGITSKLGTPSISGADPTSFFAIPLGVAGVRGTIDWTPATHLGGWVAWGRTALEWMLWIVFAGWMVSEATTTLRAAAAAPNYVGNSSAPLIGTVMSLAAAVAVCVIIGAAAAALMSQVASTLANLSGVTSWFSDTAGSTVAGLLGQFVPFSLAVSIAMTAFSFKFVVESIGLGLMVTIRALAA